MQASVAALLALAQRQATFWWKPHDTRDNTTTVEQTAALLASKGVTELIIYCQMFLGANATLHFNTSSHGGGSRALCGPAFRATKAHGMRAQLIFGNQQTKDDTSKSLRNATWVAQASAAPAKIAAALRSVIDDISHEAGGGAVVDGINFDFEPWPHARDARTGDAYSTLLSTVGDLLPQDVSVCVNNWTALFSNYSQMAAAAEAGTCWPPTPIGMLDSSALKRPQAIGRGSVNIYRHAPPWSPPRAPGHQPRAMPEIGRAHV